MKKVLMLVNHDVVIYNFRKELVERLLEDGYEVVISSPYGERIDDLMQMVQFVAVRRDHTVLTAPKYPVQMMDLPLLNISSSYIRESLQANHRPNFLLPAEVLAYIDQNGLYR